MSSFSSLALLGGLCASGCYVGSARDATPATLAAVAEADGWEKVEGVPVVRQTEREDCGAAALAMVLGYWGLPVTRDQINAADPRPTEQGIKAAALRDFARHLGLQAFLVKGELVDLDRELHQQHPILVGLMKRTTNRTYAHYEVVVGISRSQQRILTLDPAHGVRVNSRDGFLAEWNAAGQLSLMVFPQGSTTGPKHALASGTGQLP